MNRGAWWTTVHRVAQTWTRLKRLSSSSSKMDNTSENISGSNINMIREKRIYNSVVKKEKTCSFHCDYIPRGIVIHHSLGKLWVSL